MSEKLPAMADSELAVMQLLWENEVLTNPEIRQLLYPDGGQATAGTVQKLLERLEKKGFVSRDRTHFVHFFRATISRQEYVGGQMETLAAKLTGGSFVPMITHLVESKILSAKERREISELLKRKK